MTTNEEASQRASVSSTVEAEGRSLRYTRDTGGCELSGWLVKEGKLTKRQSPRYLFLSDSKLSNCKEKGGKPTWTVSIKDCAVGPGTRPNELVVHLPKRKVSFFAATESDFEKWIFALKKASSKDFNLNAFYKIGHVIGEGVNGEVRIGWDKITNEAVAIKSIPYEGDVLAGNDPEAEQEIEIVKKLNHPFLVKTYDIFRDTEKKRVYMVMEYVPGGELFSRVANEAGSLVTKEDSVRIARSLLSALVYLHSANIVHRDVKLENILCLDPDPSKPINIKLADFGLSSRLTGIEKSLQSLVGTSYYLAPEIISGEKYGSSVDAWALGVVFYIMMSGQFPFCGESDEEYYKNVGEQELEFPEEQWKDVNPDAIDLIRGLLEKDPEKRVRPDEALRHRWLDQQFSSLSTDDVASEHVSEHGLGATLKSLRFGIRKTPGQILAKLEAAEEEGW